MIPLKIETLLEGQVVEKNRVEYKKGWNSKETVGYYPEGNIPIGQYRMNILLVLSDRLESL